MSSSKQSRHSIRSQLNVIKRDSSQDEIRIADFKYMLEEIAPDEKNEVEVNLKGLEEDVSSKDNQWLSNPENAPNSERQAEQALISAFEKGFEAGKTESAKVLQEEYEKRVHEVVNTFSSIVHEFAEEAKKYNREFERSVVTLALAIAKRIVASELEIDESAVLARSREAIRKIIGVEKIKIHVNPADEEYIREHRNDLSSYADSVKEIVIEADNKVERGGCIIESELGNIDARISTQFELVEEALVGLVKQQ